MTLREFGYSLERWGVSLLEWFIEYLRVFFWQTSWLDASLFMLFWVVVGYFAILGIGLNWYAQLLQYATDQIEHRDKYKEDEEYRKEYDAEQERQRQEQLRKDEEEKERLKNAPFYERHALALWFVFVLIIVFLPILAEWLD